MNHRKAFTLIELLVVIAIIAILAAILFPVFAQAKEAAKKTQCLSNQKNINLGVIMYQGDVDDTFPMDQWYTATGDQVRWYDAVNPYIKNGDKFAFNGRVSGEGGIWSCPSTQKQQALYGVHNFLFPDGQSCPWINGTSTATVNASSLQTPADTVVIVEKGLNKGDNSWIQFVADEWNWTNTVGNPAGSVEGEKWDIDKTRNHDCDYSPGAYTDAQYGTYGLCSSMPRYRHNGVSNMAFGDGHVKSTNRGRLSWFKNVYLPGVMPTPY